MSKGNLKMKNSLKLLWLHIVRIFRHVFKNIGFKLSILFVIFSFLVSAFLLVPSAFSRAPIFSYFINTMELPLAYQFKGRILLIDSEGVFVKQNINIFIGGYRLNVASGDDFLLDFSSPPVDYLYITIEYVDSNGNESIFMKKLFTNNESNIKEDIKIYV